MHSKQLATWVVVLLLVAAPLLIQALTGNTPTVSAIYPSRFAPGTPVTIGGTGFSATRNVVTVTGTGTSTKNFVGPAVQNGTLFSFVFPSTLPAGSYTLTLHNGSQTSASFPFTVVSTITPPAPPSATSTNSSLSISPNPCVLDATGKCTTIIRWDTPATTTMLWVSKNGASPVLVACAGKNATTTIPWIVQGSVYEFSVYAVPNCSAKLSSPAGLEWLASVSVTGVPQGSLVYPGKNIGAVHLELFTQYQGRHGQGALGTDAEMQVGTAMARKALDDAKMLAGANYVRIAPAGFWPQDLALWQNNPTAYWALMDTMMHDMYARGLSAEVDLTWHYTRFSTLAGDTLSDFFGNPNSASYQLWARYVREFVTRYKNDPQASIYLYMIGNESNLSTDLDGRALHCAQSAGWLCENFGNYSTNQMLAFQTRAASLIRTLDSTRPITSGNSVARPSAYHLQRKPGWLAGGPDWTLDTKAQLVSHLTYITQGMDLLELHFYNFPSTDGSKRDNERFCPGPDCIEGANNADLLDVYQLVADAMGKKLHIGEYGDFDPYLKDFLPDFGPFVRNILDKTVALQIPYSAPWSFEFYLSRTSTYSQSGSFQNIEPGYTDSLLTYIRNTNASLGSVTVPPLISLPFVHAILTNPLDGATLTGTSTLLYAVASAPRVDATIQNVKFYVDDVLVSIQTKPPYQFRLPHSSLKVGAHKFNVTATDTAGHSVNSFDVSVTCDATTCAQSVNECFAPTYAQVQACLALAAGRPVDAPSFNILMTSDMILDLNQVIRLQNVRNVTLRGAGGALLDQPVRISETTARMESDASNDRYMIEVLGKSDHVTVSNLTLIDAPNSTAILKQKCRAGANPDPAKYTLWDPPFCYPALFVGGVSAQTDDIARDVTIDKVTIISNKASVFEVRRTTGLTVTNSVFDGATVHGIFFHGTYPHIQTVFKNNRFSHAGTAALNLHNVDDVLVEGNVFFDNHIIPQFLYCEGGGTPPQCVGGTKKFYPGGQLYAADVANAPVRNVRILNNELFMTPEYLGHQTTVGIEIDNGTRAPLSNVLIEGNYVHDMSRNGIAIHNATTTALNQRDVIVRNNQVFDTYLDFPTLNLPATAGIQLESNPAAFPNNMHPYVDLDSNQVRKGSGGPGMSGPFAGTPKTCFVNPSTRPCPPVEIRWQITGAPATTKPILKVNNANMKGYVAGTMEGTISIPWMTTRNYSFSLHLDASDPYPIAVINVVGVTP